MRRLFTIALLASASALPAQSIWDATGRMAPQFNSYEIKAPFNEKISEFSLPFVVLMPLTSALTVDIGTAFASVNLERQTLDNNGNPTTAKSNMSGLTDTQIRANYSFGQDLVVVTLGVNVPTGSATVGPEELDAATRIGSDFLTFPISGFGSGFGVTGGVAMARPVGDWNFGFGASLRHSSEYEPFKDAAGTTLKFQPGPEYRARLGADKPFGTGRMSFGLTFSKFGDDKANASSYNTGDRFVGQFAVSNSLRRNVDYSFVVWNLYRTSGTLIDASASPSGNITNALLAFGLRAFGGVGVEPSIESRLWTQTGSTTSLLNTLGMRFYVNRGRMAIVPGFGFSFGLMESATVTGFRASLGARLGN